MSLSSVVKLLLLFALLWWFAGKLQRTIADHALTHTRLEPSTRIVVAAIARYFVLLVGIVLILQNARLNLSALGVLAGAVGVGVGFGLQNIVSNFISGLIIMLERPFRIGDRIEIGNIQGTVQEIGARRTTVVTEDRLAILVPNQKFILEQVTNQVYEEKPIRLRIAVSVPSGADAELMRAVLCEAAQEHPKVLKDPPPEALITALGGAATSYELAVWHEARGPLRLQLASELNFLVGHALRKHKIKGAWSGPRAHPREEFEPSRQRFLHPPQLPSSAPVVDDQPNLTRRFNDRQHASALWRAVSRGCSAAGPSRAGPVTTHWPSHSERVHPQVPGPR